MRQLIGQIAIILLVLGGLGLSYFNFRWNSFDIAIPLLIWTLIFVPLGIWTKKNPKAAFLSALIFYLVSVIIKDLLVGGEYLLPLLFHIYFAASMIIGFTSEIKVDKKQFMSLQTPDTKMDVSKITGKDFEFLLTPSDIEVKANDFDNIMTPDSMAWTKIIKNDWTYYQVDKDEFSYSWEMPGIQMTFNPEISYIKAKQIADEVVRKLTKYSGEEVQFHFIPKDKIVRFDQNAS